MESLGKRVPEAPRSAELFDDSEHTQAIDDLSEAQTGDIVFLTDETAQREPMWYHVGVLLVGPDGVRWITHNASQNGFAVIERLEDAMANPIYGTIAGIKRAISENPNSADHDFLEEHGLGALVQIQ